MRIPTDAQSELEERFGPPMGQRAATVHLANLAAQFGDVRSSSIRLVGRLTQRALLHGVGAMDEASLLISQMRPPWVLGLQLGAELIGWPVELEDGKDLLELALHRLPKRRIDLWDVDVLVSDSLDGLVILPDFQTLIAAGSSKELLNERLPHDIAAVVVQGSKPGAVTPLPLSQANELRRTIALAFAGGHSMRIWPALTASVGVQATNVAELAADILPDADVFLLFNEIDENAVFVVHDVQSVLSQLESNLLGVDWYMSDTEANFLVCCNEHGYVIAAGTAEAKLRRSAESHGLSLSE